MITITGGKDRNLIQTIIFSFAVSFFTAAFLNAPTQVFEDNVSNSDK